MLRCHSLDTNRGRRALNTRLMSKCNATILNCCWGPTVRTHFWIFTWCNKAPRWSSSFKNAPSSKLVGCIFMLWKWRHGYIFLQAETQREQKMKGGYSSYALNAKIQKRQPFSWLGDFMFGEFWEDPPCWPPCDSTVGVSVLSADEEAGEAWQKQLNAALKG